MVARCAECWYIARVGRVDLKQQPIFMQLYRLQSMLQAGGDLFDLRDPKGRICNFLVRNEGNDKSFQFSKPRAQAQSRIQPQDVLDCDYLDAVGGAPLFSAKARAALSAALPDELRFYECTVECKGQEFAFFLGRTLLHLPLVDKENSIYHTLTDGEKILSIATYRSHFDREFSIARDVDDPTCLVVSQRLVDLCKRESLRIGFAEPL